MKVFCLLFLFIPMVAFAEKATNNDDFIYQGKPIGAPCVAAFNYSVTQMPTMTSLNLAACQQTTHRYYQITHTKSNGVYYFYKNNKDTTAGTYQYQVLGKTQNDIYVIETIFNTGGTFWMDELLFLRITKDGQLHRLGYWMVTS